MARARSRRDPMRVAVFAWVLVGIALGALARALAAERLPLGAEGAVVAGGLGGLLGGVTESLAEGSSRYVLVPASSLGALAGAAGLLLMLHRAGLDTAYRRGRSSAR